MHVHLGTLKTQMDVLFEIVEQYNFPIEHISPTHVGRNISLFDQAIEFAKKGGIIDITTGASKYTDPYKSVIYALTKGASIDKLTFSSDGHAGLSKMDANGKQIGFKKAPIDQNLQETVKLIQQGGLPISDAIKLVTINPATNLGLKKKGRIAVGADADMCWFDEKMQLNDVFSKGEALLKSGKILFQPSFD